MKIVTTIEEIKKEIDLKKKEGKTIGFVPTMGYLHEGHLSLVERAKQENDVTVMSVFVNPLQFGPNEDYQTYPRDIKRDEELAKQKGVDLFFAPAKEEMYPEEPAVTVKVTKRVDVLCGKSRPGHFDGVATVLTKLFHIITPDRVYFGLKDAQQVAVVTALIKDLNFPIEIVPVETVREEDGLAKSSRNVRLDEQERKEAVHLYQSLLMAKEMIENKVHDQEAVIEKMKAYLTEKTSGVIDYIDILTYPDLKQLNVFTGKIIVAIAVKFKHVRLIDNIIIDLT